MAATQAFLRYILQARKTLKEIEKAVDEHLGYIGDDINWGHVGDAAHVVEGLDEVLQFINGTEEK